MAGVKGYPSQKKLTGTIPGYTPEESATQSEFVTVQPQNSDRFGLDTIQRAAFKVSSSTDLCESTSDTRVIKATGHVAKVGDFIRFITGTQNEHVEVSVISVPDANHFVLGTQLDFDPDPGDAFYVLRYITPELDSNGGFSSTDPGNDVTDTGRIDYNSTNVGSTSWVPILTSTAANSTKLTLFDGGGYSMELGTGASGSETRLCLIPPGGFNGAIPVKISASTRISVRAVGTTTVSAGELILNLLG